MRTPLTQTITDVLRYADHVSSSGQLLSQAVSDRPSGQALTVLCQHTSANAAAASGNRSEGQGSEVVKMYDIRPASAELRAEPPQSEYSSSLHTDDAHIDALPP